ncbi:hypothetical protein VTH06DRAFT_3184 [Thermothelomyces fergusii]
MARAAKALPPCSRRAPTRLQDRQVPPLILPCQQAQIVAQSKRAGLSSCRFFPADFSIRAGERGRRQNSDPSASAEAQGSCRTEETGVEARSRPLQEDPYRRDPEKSQASLRNDKEARRRTSRCRHLTGAVQGSRALAVSDSEPESLGGPFVERLVRKLVPSLADEDWKNRTRQRERKILLGRN